MTGSSRTIANAWLVMGVVLAVTPWIVVAALGARGGTLRAAIDPGSILEDQGFGWRVQVTPRTAMGRVHGLLFEFPSDHGSSTTSELRLFEDERELGPNRAVHRDIRERGEGRFSHWRRDLFFSTSDNSDPRTNGRRYVYETPVTVSRAAALLALLGSCAGATMVWWSAPVRARTARWRERWIAGTGLSPLISPWRPTPLPMAWRWLMLGAWLLCAGIAATIGRGEHDPYLLSTVPTTGYGDHTNALPGYAAMIDGSPRHAENIQTWDHIAMFNGSIIAADMYANRPLYPFLVSCVAWALGVAGASLLVNLVAWAIGTWATIRVGAEFAGRPEAGVVAGLASCLGAGWWFHLGDASAHLLSFTTSAVALLMILRSRVWAVRQPAEVHAAIGAVLVVASLAYNSGLFFAAAYGLLALRHNRWWHVITVALAALLVQRLWPPLLNALSNGNFDYYQVERGLLHRALNAWPIAWRDGIALRHAADVAIDSLVAAATLLPLIIVGVLAPLFGGVRHHLVADPRPERGAVALMLLVVILPTIALVVFSPTATARGYLIFFAAAAIFAIAGALFARLRPGVWRGLGTGLLLLGLTGQALFVTRHAVGDARAVKLFLWGLPEWSAPVIAEALRAPRTIVAGLAGEPAPRIAGGDASLLECGASDGGEAMDDLPSFKNPLQVGQMLVVRGVLVLTLGLGAHLLLRSGLIRLSRGSPRAPPLAVITALMAVILVVPPLLTRWRGSGPEHHRHMIHDRRLPARAREVVLEIQVDPRALLLLEQVAVAGSIAAHGDERDGDRVTPLELDCLVGFGWSEDPGAGVIIDILAGGEPMARFDTEGSGRQRRRLDLARTLAALRRDPTIEVIARRADGIVQVASWQRGDLPGRTLRLDGATARPSKELALPLLELRVVPRDRNFLPRLLLY